MRDALNRTGRPILFSACEWGVDFPATWMQGVANSWRTTFDIQYSWECVVAHVDWTNIYADFAKPGAFNDMDILNVGNPHSACDFITRPLRHDCDSTTPTMNMTEWRSHYLWIVMKVRREACQLFCSEAS